MRTGTIVAGALVLAVGYTSAAAIEVLNPPPPIHVAQLHGAPAGVVAENNSPTCKPPFQDRFVDCNIEITVCSEPLPTRPEQQQEREQRVKEGKVVEERRNWVAKACTIAGGGSNTSTATTTTCYSTLDDGSEIINTEVEAQQKATEGLLLKNPACACQRFVESIGKCDFYTRVCSRFRKAAPSFIAYFGIACLGGEVENSIRANCASSSFPYDPLTAKDEAVSSLYRRKHSLC